MITVFNRHLVAHPLKEMAYGGNVGSKLRRMVGNQLHRLERGQPYYRPKSSTPVQAVPQFATQVINSPTPANSGGLVYNNTDHTIKRPSRIGHNQVL